MTSNKLFLLDGMALVYRGHFAFANRPIRTSSGFNTSAIFGFINTLVQLLGEHEPTHLAVVFDTAAPTERHEAYPEYKGNRDEMPEELSAQLPHVRRFVEALNIPVILKDGYEADDIIGTLARQAEAAGWTTYMVTPDKDFGQLVDKNTLMYKPARMGDGVEILGVKEVCAKWGIERVEQVIDMLGLMGDSSDNIPGVPGIGQKTAQKLLATYGSIENLLEHTGELKGKQKENLETFADQARLSKKLATILTEVPLEMKLDGLERTAPDAEAVAALCVEFEFNTLGKRLLGEGFHAGRGGAREGELALDDGVPQPASVAAVAASPNATTIEDVKHTYHAVTEAKDRAALVERLLKTRRYCFDLETDGMDPRRCGIVGMAFAVRPHEAWFVHVPEDEKEAAAIVNEFRPVFEKAGVEKIGHNLKFDLTVLRWHGVTVAGPFFDTMIAHALVEPDLRHSMDFLAESYLAYRPVSITSLIGEKKGEQKSMREVDATALTEYAGEDADVTLQLADVLKPLLAKSGQESVFNDIESPLLPVLVDMEFEGITLDTQVLAEIAVQLEEAMTRLEKEIYAEAGHDFNLNSPKQLGEVLFGEMKLVDKPKKTRTGQFKTDEQTLQDLAHRCPIVQYILDFREASKLKSTYVDALPSSIHPRSKRIHTTYNQLVTATGRLNSTDPNLQNIPIRTEMGREVRKAFVARDKQHLLLSADYSQIELRIIAALSDDTGMLEAFESGEDIHRATAAKVYGVGLDEVDDTMRRTAKMVNFGIIYGISAFGLSQRLGIPRGEASDIIEAYFAQYPGVRQYMDDTIEFAKQHGYVETLCGRRRVLREINSANATVRSAVERTAINTPIQGTAADMIKIAMVKVFAALEEANLKTRMILQVHDELVFELVASEKDAVTELVTREMKGALPQLKVPIVVEVGTGRDWLAAH